MKKLNFVIPEALPEAAVAKPKERRSFWAKLGGALLAVAVVGTEVAAASYEVNQRAQEEKEQRERQNQSRQQQIVSPTQTSSCHYLVLFGSPSNDEFVITPIMKVRKDCNLTLDGVYAKTSDSFNELAYWRSDVIEAAEKKGKKVMRNWNGNGDFSSCNCE